MQRAPGNSGLRRHRDLCRLQPGVIYQQGDIVMAKHDLAACMHIAGRQHLAGNVMTIRPYKTRGNDVVVTLELPDALMDIINRTKTGDLHFIVSDKGKPYTAESFSNWFRKACRAAGVNKSAHGVRKLSSTLAANGGATVHDLMAQYGWTTSRQAEIYTKGAERAKLGMKNSRMLAEQIEAAKIPHPKPGAGSR
ncbi:tyrosine-type recombinase/integrase [Rhizobium sp. TRM95796]|uniref:tyrosine-type recombinase/integrase n=1 Tax=Rhizobium sp. TRM95796 TaxID=2979862 RepID=UPI0021E90F33|nr:tyrosine-type recombinase/integrase [Rhizobium sp. TRM95796]MCV3764994.1 tyrosine-type recombinase/integrase [Rhizobium sp. TRM95796]